MIAPPSSVRCSGWRTSSKAIKANRRERCGPKWESKRSRRSRQHTKGQIELLQQFVVEIARGQRGNAREVIAIGSGQPAMGGRRVVRRIANMALLSQIPYHR